MSVSGNKNSNQLIHFPKWPVGLCFLWSAASDERLLVFASTVILDATSYLTHDHIFLRHDSGLCFFCSYNVSSMHTFCKREIIYCYYTVSCYHSNSCRMLTRFMNVNFVLCHERARRLSFQCIVSVM
jgi:hypothetical protein